MLKIRLSRTGKKSQPSFRVVVQEHTAAVKGKSIEALGYYRPAIESKEFVVDLERIKHWLSVGAKPSDSMAVLLKKQGLENMDQYIAPRDKQKKSKKEKAAEPAAAQPATPAPAATPAPEAAQPAPEPAVEAPAEPPTETAEAPAEAPAEPPTETAEAAAEAPAEPAAEAPTEPAAEPPAESEPAPETTEKS